MFLDPFNHLPGETLCRYSLLRSIIYLLICLPRLKATPKEHLLYQRNPEIHGCCAGDLPWVLHGPSYVGIPGTLCRELKWGRFSVVQLSVGAQRAPQLRERSCPFSPIHAGAHYFLTVSNQVFPSTQACPVEGKVV